jgi:CheY-like chemotaxis protein
LLHIILIEDNPADVFILEMALKQATVPVQLTHINSGEKAIKYLTDGAVSRKPDLVLLDVSLPKVSGFEVLETIRANEELKGLPVVVMSGAEDPAEIEYCYRAGANSYIIKPPQLDETLLLIDHLVTYWFKWVRLPSNPQGRRSAKPA